VIAKGTSWIFSARFCAVTTISPGAGGVSEPVVAAVCALADPATPIHNRHVAAINRDFEFPFAMLARLPPCPPQVSDPKAERNANDDPQQHNT
jgi:hypothetical protein